jgi:ubiquinone/menaquinone biosynthesis C-methylase UbiE
MSAINASSSPLAFAAAGRAFDALANTYDQKFTHSLIGRAQRDAVWKSLRLVFRPGDRLLELNCGTGEDAFFLSRQGVSVVACDASKQMIHAAQQRLDDRHRDATVAFVHLATEQLGELEMDYSFDGVFSNFSGLNCVADLEATAEALAKRVRPGGRLLLCLSTRFCILETLHFMFQGRWRQAFRRWTGRTEASIGGLAFAVQYPTIRRLRKLFSPHFTLRSYSGVGVALPPSYLEQWARDHPRVFQLLCNVEPILSAVPILRVTGDHVLLYLERSFDEA